MGPLLAAMPRTDYKGAFSGNLDASNTRLVGGDDEEVEMIARQMASRLSRRLQIPVLVSCSFEGAPDVITQQGIDSKELQHRAAALAEREIAAVLLRRRPT